MPIKLTVTHTIEYHPRDMNDVDRPQDDVARSHCQSLLDDSVTLDDLAEEYGVDVDMTVSAEEV